MVEAGWVRVTVEAGWTWMIVEAGCVRVMVEVGWVAVCPAPNEARLHLKDAASKVCSRSRRNRVGMDFDKGGSRECTLG